MMVSFVRPRKINVPLSVVHNLCATYGLYCSNYLLALVTVPYLVRVLGPSDWGLVAFVQAFGGYLLQLVEFGFGYSGTREVARHRESLDKLGEIVASVLGAKALLALACIALALIAQHWVAAFREHAGLFWSGVGWALAQGSNLMWFYQGREQMRVAVTADLAVRILGVASVFWFVRGPADSWKVLGLQGAASVISLTICLALIYREVPFRLPNLQPIVSALRRSVTSFAPRNASVMYTVGNAFILGLFAPPHIVGYYAGADRIGRAIVGLLGPASDALYPRISHLALHSRLTIRRIARISIGVMGGMGTVMGALIFAFAPQLVGMLLGPGFEEAVVVLRIFSILPPVVALRNVLGIHWMLPLDLDGAFNTIVLGTGVLNVVLAVILAPRYADLGAAWAAVIAQSLATVATYGLLRWMRLDPLSRSTEYELLRDEDACRSLVEP